MHADPDTYDPTKFIVLRVIELGEPDKFLQLVSSTAAPTNSRCRAAS